MKKRISLTSGVAAFTLACVTSAVLLSGCAQQDQDENLGASKDVSVPIILALDYAIAGAEFEFEYTDGLEFVDFEKSEVVESAMTTPVVEKNGKTYFGFFNGSNDYVPSGGELLVGNLIFCYDGSEEQSITLTEVKYVEVIDADNTNSELLQLNTTIGVPGETLHVKAETAWLYWIIGGACILLAITLVSSVLLRRKKRNGN